MVCIRGKFKGLVLLLLALVLLAACGASKTIELDAADNGAAVELSPGQVVAISLDSNPSTGYSWEAVDLDESILKQDGEPEFEQAPGLVGANGLQTLRFKAVGAGTITLKLVYHRPWETGIAPLETWTVEVTVR